VARSPDGCEVEEFVLDRCCVLFIDCISVGWCCRTLSLLVGRGDLEGAALVGAEVGWEVESGWVGAVKFCALLLAAVIAIESEGTVYGRDSNGCAQAGLKPG